MKKETLKWLGFIQDEFLQNLMSVAHSTEDKKLKQADIDEISKCIEWVKKAKS